MAPNDLTTLLRLRPFRKIKLRISNGNEYVIGHPELALVQMSLVWLHLPTTNPLAVAEKRFAVTLRHVVEVELLPLEPTATGNGSGG
jgi:hypothetical protein